jgi:enoyl-CoA hydratase/carnithine racemase
MAYDLVLVSYEGDFATVTLNNPKRRNALSVQMMQELTAAFREVGESSARGVFLAANGSVFSSGHDFADMEGQDLMFMRRMMRMSATLMETIQSIPQPVLARVHAMALAGGCQLVVSCDLAVAAEEVQFGTPGGEGGWFCTTPMVAVSRNIGRKRAMELLLTGDRIDARTAVEWGMINRAVPGEQLLEEAQKLLTAATRGSRASKAIGKQAFYAQVDLDQPKAYAYAIEVMAATALAPHGQENIKAFIEKRHGEYD